MTKNQADVPPKAGENKTEALVLCRLAAINEIVPILHKLSASDRERVIRVLADYFGTAP